MDIPRVGHGQIPSLQKLPMAEMPLEAYKGGLLSFTLLCKHDLIADQRTGVDVYGTNHADLAAVVREGQRQGIDKGQYKINFSFSSSLSISIFKAIFSNHILLCLSSTLSSIEIDDPSFS